MDTSISFSVKNFITSGGQVPRDQVTPELWLELIRQAMRTVRPRLKYLPGFQSLVSPQLEGPLKMEAVMTVATNHLPSHLLYRYMVGRVFMVPTTRWMPEDVASIYLTRGGYWVDAGMTINSPEPNPFCRMLTDEDLLELIRATDERFAYGNCQGQLGYLLLASLHDMISVEVPRRRARLDDMQSAQATLQRMLGRIRNTGSERN